MKLQRTSQPVDLGAFSLDGTDAYLLSRVQDQVSLAELCDLMPCTPLETEERVENLVRVGLLSMEIADLEWRPHDDTVPDFGELSLDDPASPLGAAPWEDTLPLPGEDALPYPSPASFADLIDASHDDGEAPFVADPPSTLISLFKRGPLQQVEIHTVSAAARAPTSSAASGVRRKPDAFEQALDEAAAPRGTPPTGQGRR